jgi:integrase
MAVYQNKGRKTFIYDFWKHGVRHREGGFLTEKEAQEEEARAKAFAKRINLDFAKLCASRLEDLKLRRSEGHWERNDKLFKILKLKWATLKQVTRDDVEEHLKETVKISKHKANRELAMIKALYNHGIERNWFDQNPTKGIKPFGIDKEPKYIPPIEDIKAVLEVASHEERIYLLTILHTMCRVREINRLKWEQVYDDCILVSTKKAKNSNTVYRYIPFTPTLKEIFKGLKRTGEYVFTNPRTQDKYQYRIKLIRGLCKKAKVKPFTYHNLRHWGASKLAMEKVPLTDIQKLLGHTRATTTDTYLQSLTPMLISSIKKLEE